MRSLGEAEIALINNLIYLNYKWNKRNPLQEQVRELLASPHKLMVVLRNHPAGMKEEEWISILKAIKDRECFDSIYVRKQSWKMGYDRQGLNAACFIAKENKEALFVFRGTGAGEWLDNGKAFSQVSSPQQQEALAYFEKVVEHMGLEEAGYTIDVSGHSKGGNKAQYITILSDKVNKCYSFDGQGFSDEFVEKYKTAIKDKRQKIHTIATENDYVHCLGNNIAGKVTWYKGKEGLANTPLNHCPNAYLTENGDFKEKVEKQSVLSKLINNYTTELMKLPKDIKEQVFMAGMGLAQIYLGKSQPVEGKIPSGIEIYNGLKEGKYEFLKSLRNNTQLKGGQLALVRMLYTPIIQLVSVGTELAKPFFINPKIKEAMKEILATIKFIKEELGKLPDRLQTVFSGIKVQISQLGRWIENRIRPEQEKGVPHSMNAWKQSIEESKKGRGTQKGDVKEKGQLEDKHNNLRR